eukprot:1425250-Pleurochrysis_carterae.AAC.1
MPVAANWSASSCASESACRAERAVSRGVASGGQGVPVVSRDAFGTRRAFALRRAQPPPPCCAAPDVRGTHVKRCRRR